MEVLLKLLEESPESVVALIKGWIEKYKLNVYELLKEISKVYADYVNNDEWFALCAEGAKKKFDSYVAAGFTEDQAFTLMLNSNAALANSLQNIKVSNSKGN